MAIDGGGDLPADEYDRYLRQVQWLLLQGAENALILSFLDRVERERLGIASAPGAKEAFVRAVRAELARFGAQPE